MGLPTFIFRSNNVELLFLFAQETSATPSRIMRESSMTLAHAYRVYALFRKHGLVRDAARKGNRRDRLARLTVKGTRVVMLFQKVEEELARV